MNPGTKKEQKNFCSFLKIKPEPHHRTLPGEEVSQGGTQYNGKKLTKCQHFFEKSQHT
jgi:hypothetical protein